LSFAEGVAEGVAEGEDGITEGEGFVEGFGIAEGEDVGFAEGEDVGFAEGDGFTLARRVSEGKVDVVADIFRYNT
jgi:hypothetical protein